VRALVTTYPLIERFVTVYAIGLSVSVLLTVYSSLRTPPGYATAVLALASFMAANAFARRHARAPSFGEYLLVLLLCAALLFASKWYIAGAFAKAAGMNGPGLWRSMVNRTATDMILVVIVLSPWFVRMVAGRAHMRQPAPRMQIPLSVGFADLGSGNFEAQREADRKAIAPLFLKSAAPPPGHIPTAQVLFVYAALGEDGTIQGLPQKSGIRQIAEKTQAAVVVVANSNPQGAVQAAARLPGAKSANLVFVLDRKGDGLARFFVQLFREMMDGDHMLAAWVSVCPQGPQQSPDMPAMILLAEGGKLAFPDPVEATGK
jgi:hypothetical protein